MSNLAPTRSDLGPATLTLYQQMCTYPKHEPPIDALIKILKMRNLPNDLRAYTYAFAHHNVRRFELEYGEADWWMEPPSVWEPLPFLRLPTHTTYLFLGTMGSGHPIVAQLPSETTAHALIMNFDDEGYTYRYEGIEGYLTDWRW